ncbi:MAG: ABC transporter ATP-binding protein [Clostridia bacterium]|nr:ABC transporter ATP-binding protein [Clostridia bacterium]
MIRIEHLTVAFDGQTVLKDCSLTVPVGGHVALMGASGSGKTTLINVIAGLVKPDHGTVTARGKISYAFQEPALFPWLTALENVNVVLSDGRETLDEARKWLREAGLEEHSHKYPHQLSGGQKQRVALCRALAYGGDILLLDEPLKGLDADTRDSVAALLRRECAGKTLLLVTHDPREAEALCDAVLRYRDGQFV